MRAVLLDRDGVVNALVHHEDSGVIDGPFIPAQFKLLPRVPQAIKLFNNLGLHVAIVSNQPGIAKGHLKLATLKVFERTLLSRLRAEGAFIHRIYYCLHHPQARVAKLRKQCHCRKPEIGLLEQAANDLRVPLNECYMIGDGISDIVAGTRAGCRNVFIGRWKCEICQFTEDPHARPAFVAKSLWEAAQLIRNELNGAIVVATAECLPARA